MKFHKELALKYAAPILIILVWYSVTEAGWVSPLFIPSPKAFWDTFYYQTFVTGEIFPHVWATFWRTIAGFLIAVPIGISIGLLMGMSHYLYHALEFIVDFFRSIPATALFPLFLLFFGIGDEAKVTVAVWVCVWVIIVNTIYGVRHGSKLRSMVAKSMRVKKTKLFKDVVFPESLPHIFSGMRIALSLALIVIIVTEMFIGTNWGLGHIISDSQLVYMIPEMYVAIFYAGLLGYALNKAFVAIERRTIHWSGK
jgi:NitT/TauT family transport system permease protein